MLGPKACPHLEVPLYTKEALYTKQSLVRCKANCYMLASYISKLAG